MTVLSLKIAQIENSQIQFDDVTPRFLSVYIFQKIRAKSLDLLSEHHRLIEHGKPLQVKPPTTVSRVEESEQISGALMDGNKRWKLCRFQNRRFRNTKDEEFLVLLADTQGSIVNDNQDNVLVLPFFLHWIVVAIAGILSGVIGCFLLVEYE
ncbi:hypothetical protein M3Y98_01207100 [Aphelenchoides besseyi]|nr:hypothetical protein M3Y98_01207100 [Aphelenchoides besseyi]KAI6193248.1 hypothetical protein M3Y96_00998300 [Aphelenchoides besseyi]